LPTCHACGQDYESSGTILLVRNRAQQWVLLCRDCHQKGVSPDHLAPAPAGPDPVASAALPARPLDSFAAVGQALRLLRARRHQAVVRDRTRRQERRPVEIAVRFRLSRDDVVHTGTVVDLSKNGFRIVTPRRLEKGQVIAFDGHMPLPSALLALFRESAEVRREEPLADGRWMAGARFMQRQATDGANRRRHRRHPASFDCLYAREGSTFLSFARVCDMSQGGMMLYASEPLVRSEPLHFRVRGETGSFASGDLVGEATVLRVIPRQTHHEIGCRFDRTRVEPRRVAP